MAVESFSGSGSFQADVFGALYMMSPCCLSARDPGSFTAEAVAPIEAARSLDEAAKLGWGQRAMLASAAAWSPNPKAPPFYLDLPFKDGKVQTEVLAKWAANAPLNFVDQYVGNLRRYAAIAIDVGDQDGLRFDAQKLHAALDGYGIANAFEI